MKKSKNSTVAVVKLIIVQAFMCLVFGICLSGNGVFAADNASVPAMEASIDLKGFVDEMIRMVQDLDPSMELEKREGKLYGRAMGKFDFKTFSMLSLGRKYRSFSKAQRAEFMDSFSRLISHTYVARLEGHNLDNISIEYLGTHTLKAKKNRLRVDVFTHLIHGEIATPITYRMAKREHADWKIYDVIIEGVSMAANYREQFREYVSDPPEKIISDLKEKLKK